MNLPPFPFFPIIKGEKITLRKIESIDLIDLIEISFYNAVQATTLEDAAEMQEKINKDYLDGNSIHWGIADKLNNKILGTCGYYRGLDKGEGELGCVLLPAYQGKGFMSAALLLVIDFGKNNIALNRIWAATNKENIKACKLMERLNFKKVADLKDNEVEYEYNKA